MGKYADMLLNAPTPVGPGPVGGNVPLSNDAAVLQVFGGDSYDPNAPEPAKPSTKYSTMLLGSGTEVRPAAPGFIERATSNVSPVNDPSKMAGMGTQAVASLPTDMKERAAYFAKQRFPDDPNGVAKYGVQDGRLFYEGDDGKQYYEEPTGGISRKPGDILPTVSPSETAKYVASSAGPVLPIAGSIAGGVATLPVGGGIPGAGLGAAAGDETRQLLAMALAGQKDFSPKQTAGEAGMSMVGQAGGVAVGKFLNRGAVRDVAKTQTPQAQALINELSGKAQQEGISLTPAELTNLKSLKGQQTYLGGNSRSADTMDTFYTKRNTEEIPGAVNSMLGKISPAESVEVGAANLQTGAKEVIGAEQRALQTQAKPLYDATRNVTVSTSDYQALMKDPFLRQQMKAVMRDPKYQSDIGDLFPKAGKTTSGIELDQYGVARAVESKEPPVDAKVGFLDVVKKRIDGMIESEKSGANPNRNNVRIYTAARERLLKIADDAAPDYAKARGIYEDGMPGVTALTKGEVGLAAGKKPIQQGTVPRTMFETGPEAVGRNRAAYVKAGKEQEWNDGLRAYLQENFDQAAKEFKTGNTNPGASFRAKVFGTAKQKTAMKNSMSSDQWAGFNRLMDVLEASGRVPQGNSHTQFMAEAAAEMRSQSLGLTGKAAQNIADVPGIPRRLGNFIQDVKMGKHSEKLAEIVTSPDAMKELKQLKALNPQSLKAMGVVSQLLSQYGFSAGEPSDAPPGSFSDAPASQKKPQ